MISYRKTAHEFQEEIKKENINTWFDLGLYLDRIKEYNKFPAFEYNNSYKNFVKDISEGGIGFVTFGYSVDGVTIEIIKYIRCLHKILDNPEIHLIGGEFKPESYKVIDPDFHKFVIEEARGFDNWPLYDSFFFKKLERGSNEYNRLIKRFWKESVKIATILARYIEENNLSLLYLVNVASNPGNISLTLAVVLITELMGIPVINNNHDFYWEGGSRPIDIKLNRKKPGPRDFFFTNAHLGEVFSVIEVLFPWDSRSWITLNINRRQVSHVISKKGHNPANVMEIGTAIDLSRYTDITKREKINTYYQFEKILSRYKNLLVAYSVKDVLERGMVLEENPRPILIGHGKTRPVKHFMAENVIFFQPTRIIARKRIETGFRLISQLFRNRDFSEKFKETGNLKITILVTGPIASGQYAYFTKLIERFELLLDSLKPAYRDRVYLAFLFSELDKEGFKKRFKKPVGIPELYNVASLILLPSETEGRGLPIIEAAAAGKPVFCRRYAPEHVYAEVIGEHLTEELRLKVIEYNGKKIGKKVTKRIIERVFFPHVFIDEIMHNQNVVRQRYSFESLENTVKDILKRLFIQCRNTENELADIKKNFDKYASCFNPDQKLFRKLVSDNKRALLSGYHKLAYMIYLKSLIDPSAFRVEEQEIEGMLHEFALELLERNAERNKIPEEKKIGFLNRVDSIFRYRDGEIDIRHDHSLAYRHRNRLHYPYRDYTFQELTGLINMMYREMIKPKFEEDIIKNAHFFTDWNLSLLQLTCSPNLAIDDRDILMKKMKENIPLIIFPGSQVLYSLEFFALQAIRARIGLQLEEELKNDHLKGIRKEMEPIYIFLQKYPVKKWVSTKQLEEYIRSGYDRELNILYKNGLLHFVDTEQWTVGIHIKQLGDKALEIMAQVREKKGMLITDRFNAAVMTDILDIDRVHIGRAENPIIANILGISEGSGFIQYIPAGLRATLAYPTPVQTAKDFNRLLKSKEYKILEEELGEEVLIQKIQKDARENGSPLHHVLKQIKTDQKPHIKNFEPVSFRFLSGKYNDGNSWNGVIAKTIQPGNGRKWIFETLTSKRGTKRVTEFVTDYEKRSGNRVNIAWNGGYILNPELVGKLGLPESYIGSPLGMLVSHGQMISAPMFNKPALMVAKNGQFFISRVNASSGLMIRHENDKIEFDKTNYNRISDGSKPAYYDLMSDQENLAGDGRIWVRLAGNTVKEIIHSTEKETLTHIPVGLLLSFPKDKFPGFIRKGLSLNIMVKGYENILHAVEAGPMLVKDGKVCIDMEIEGWTTNNSIKTQAARLDFTDMRGPKIAAGIDQQGNLILVAINGRIRESVGATHFDMADILIENGAVNAMGFDPGGSSTLVVNHQVLNISPYNHLYEENIYSLPPEPRAVANAVIGYIVDDQ